MNRTHHTVAMVRRGAAAFLVSGTLLAGAALGAEKDVYEQKNLVSDLPGVAERLDPNLVNPWGISASATSPLWVANNHSGTSTVYNGAGQPFPIASPIIVTIPPPAGGSPPAAPTGTVFNPTTQFEVGPGQPARFLFATEDGTISGWNPAANPTAAILEVDRSASGAVYKGLALAMPGSGPKLYATNFRGGTVDVFDSSFNQVVPAGGFVDSMLPEGYAPFGIAAFGNKLYVTFALQNAEKMDDVSGQGHGFVDVFDTDGNLVRRLIRHGQLDSPWGLAMAPQGFGRFGRTLLVGNFGDGRINAYEPESGEFRGTLRNRKHRPVTNQGLWALHFGNGGNGGDPLSLYFTAGIPGNDSIEDHGLFGVIRAVDESEAKH